MNYLVTGGAGFIGSHLVARLLKEDCDVLLIVDDLSEGALINLPKDPRIKFFKASILDNKISKCFKDIDVVFHLAALTRPQWSMIHPEETCRTNVEGTIRIFNNCVKHKVKRVVFVSSSSLYGDQLVFPTPETAPANPLSPYGLTKYEGELWAELYKNLYNLQVNSIRPFNVYGSRQNPNSPYSAAAPKFLNELKRGETPWITGDGEQARDFIYVDDVVEIIYRASKCKEYGEAFNAGSGTNISINKLYDLVCRIMGKYVKPDYVAPVVEPNMTLGDMSKVKRILNFEPKIGLEEGLRRTIDEDSSIR